MPILANSAAYCIMSVDPKSSILRAINIARRILRTHITGSHIISTLVTKLHKLIFGHDVTADMTQFLKFLSWSLFGITFSAFVFFTMNVLAGRLLGPVEYGKYNLVVTISGILAVVMSLGFDLSTVKHVSSSNDEEEKNHYLSNSLLIISFSSIVILTLMLALSPSLAAALYTSKSLIAIGTLYSIVFVYKIFFDAIIRGLSQFKSQALIKLLEALVALAMFVLLIVAIGHREYVYYVIAISTGALISIVAYFWTVRNRLRSWSQKHFLIAKPYALSVFSNSIASVVIASADKLTINNALGASTLGVYSAYLVSTTIVASQIAAAIGNVFFPAINQSVDKLGLMHKIDKLAKWIAIPFVVFIGLLSVLIILLFGAKFSLNPLYITLSSIVAFLQLIAILYATIPMTVHSSFVIYTKFIYVKLVLILIAYYVLFALRLVSITSVLELLILSSIYDIIVSRNIVINKLQAKQ